MQTLVCDKLGPDYCEHSYCKLDSDNNCRLRDEYVAHSLETLFDGNDRSDESVTMAFLNGLLKDSHVCDLPVQACHLLNRDVSHPICTIMDGKCQFSR